MYIIARILLTAVALLVAAYVVPGIEIAGPYIAIIVAILLGILNLIVRPILIVLTLPITIVTLGLFLFVINAVLFWFVASFVRGFTVDSFGTALLGSVVVSLVSALGSRLLLNRE